MPEIGEVARIVHYLRTNLAGKRIASVQVQDDDIIYGKVGTSASAFKAAMTGKTILDARQQGKYFWLVCDKPPHPVMHLGMTGWIKFSNFDTSYYRSKKEEDGQWPPRFWKFILKTEGEGNEAIEAAFVDARRLARIRLVEADGEELRNTSPLKENGPDPVIDKDILTHEWLVKKCNSKKVPIKALLLDQAVMSGVGNWVADEVLYQARIHPEQYSNAFNDEELKRLHDALVYVCTTAVDTLSESAKFPADWLMKHRWNSGKKGKDVNVLPNGEKIVHLKVGGRTSAIVPTVQKKTGHVAGDVKVDNAGEDGDDGKVTTPKGRGRKRKSDGQEVKQEEEAAPAKKGRKAKTVKDVEPEEDEEAEEESRPKPKTKANSKTTKGGRKSGASSNGTSAKAPEAKASKEESGGRRRSARLSSG